MRRAAALLMLLLPAVGVIAGGAAWVTVPGATFKSALDGLTGKLAALSADHAGAPVAVTEPVPLYLLEAAGLVNKTPEDYTAAIEEGTDVPPAVLKVTSTQ